MLSSIIDFLNMTIWYIDGYVHMRIFHVLILLVCTYCIVDELIYKRNSKHAAS